MSKLKVGIIGCGRPQKIETPTGWRIRPGQGNLHAEAYKASPECELVAAADINSENLDLFCDSHDILQGYGDYRQMLAKEKLDIVSICVWPGLHAPMVIDAAEAGVHAIHCEKPLAPTWGEAKRMGAACEARGVQLTINHQRRFGPPFRKAKALLDSGAIGDLLRMEMYAINLYDWGTHWFDMMFFYNNEVPVEWVMGQVDARCGRTVFGVRVEGQGLSLLRWQNGVEGLVVTFGRQNPLAKSARGQACGNRLVGTRGVIEVAVAGGPQVRLLSSDTGGEWQDVLADNPATGQDDVTAAIADLVDALRTGREPELSARRGLKAAELTFATYESSRRRARVDLPLDVEDSPFLSMVESGALSIDG